MWCHVMSHLLLQRGFDVFNALDLMENKQFLEKLKFGIGDGNLQYYLYNWKCPDVTPEQVSIVSVTYRVSPTMQHDNKRKVETMFSVVCSQLYIHCTAW